MFGSTSAPHGVKTWVIGAEVQKKQAESQIVAGVYHLPALKYSAFFFLPTSFRDFSCFMLPVPCGIGSIVIISYAEQLCPIFTSICQLARVQLRLPCSRGRRSAELPVASSRSEALGDYGLFVLASLVMKSWAGLGKEELLAKTEHLHDPFPLTLRPNRVCSPVILLDLIFKHLEGSDSHAWLISSTSTFQGWLGSPHSIYIMFYIWMLCKLADDSRIIYFTCKRDRDSFYPSQMTCFLSSANINQLYWHRIFLHRND